MRGDSKPSGTRQQVVLVADDHDGVRRALAAHISTLFSTARVIEATNGREALEVAMRESPALILMDVKMPEMDGIAATRHVKARMPKTKVVICTLSDDTHTRRAAQDAGADAYVPKGDITSMGDTLQRFLT